MLWKKCTVIKMKLTCSHDELLLMLLNKKWKLLRRGQQQGECDGLIQEFITTVDISGCQWGSLSCCCQSVDHISGCREII